MAAPTGRIADKLGTRRPLLGGLALATLGILWIGFAAPWDSYALLLPGLLVWGFSLTFCFIPGLRATMNAVPPAQHGQVGGITMTARLLGGTFGMAVCSTLLAMTGSFQVVFLATGALMLAALVVGWFAIERRGEASGQ